MKILHILICIIGWVIMLSAFFMPFLLRYCKHLEAKLAKEEEDDRLYELFNVRG